MIRKALMRRSDYFCDIENGDAHRSRLYYNDFTKEDGEVLQLINFREFFSSEIDGFVATKKGVTFDVDHWYSFFNGVNKLHQYLIEEGIIEDDYRNDQR